MADVCDGAVHMYVLATENRNQIDNSGWLHLLNNNLYIGYNRYFYNNFIMYQMTMQKQLNQPKLYSKFHLNVSLSDPQLYCFGSCYSSHRVISSSSKQMLYAKKLWKPPVPLAQHHMADRQ